LHNSAPSQRATSHVRAWIESVLQLIHFITSILD